MTEKNIGSQYYPKPASNPEDPDYITRDLCQAYRQSLEQRFLTVDEKIKGLRNQIIGAITLSTAIISIFVYLLSLRP